MDQIIDKFGIDWKIFSAEILNFLILLAILSLVFYKKIFSIIEERQKKIDEGLTRAEEADKIVAEAENKKVEIISEARKEAEEKVLKSVEIGKNKKEDIIQKAKNESERIVDSARKSGLEEKEKIISSSKEDIAKMIVLGAEKVLAQK